MHLVLTAITITVVTDRYPGETDWFVTDSGGAIVAQRTEFLEVYHREDDVVNLPDGEYTVEVTDSYQDGLCCNHGTGSFEVTTSSGVLIMNVRAFQGSASKVFAINNGLFTFDAPLLNTINQCSIPEGFCNSNSDCCSNRCRRNNNTCR